MLIDHLVDMHTKMAHRNNASSALIGSMGQLGKPLSTSLAAGLLTLDSIHAPIADTVNMVRNWMGNMAHENLGDNAKFWTDNYPGKVPGYGSAWYKKVSDPAVEEFFTQLDPDLLGLADAFTGEVQAHTGRAIYPNAAMATAWAAIELEIPAHEAMSLVIKGRISAWCDIYSQNYINRGF